MIFKSFHDKLVCSRNKIKSINMVKSINRFPSKNTSSASHTYDQIFKIIIRNTVEDLLELEDMETERAENGQVAVEMFSAKPEGLYDALAKHIPEQD